MSSMQFTFLLISIAVSTALIIKFVYLCTNTVLERIAQMKLYIMAAKKD